MVNSNSSMRTVAYTWLMAINSCNPYILKIYFSFWKSDLNDLMAYYFFFRPWYKNDVYERPLGRVPGG